jgi:hypothetical protein
MCYPDMSFFQKNIVIETNIFLFYLLRKKTIEAKNCFFVNHGLHFVSLAYKIYK